MKKTMKFAAVAAVIATMAGSSAFAEPRHRNETNDGGWRSGARNDGRYNDGRYNDGRYNDGYGNDMLRGVVERVDFRRGTVLVREDRTGRRTTVYMAGGRNNRRGIDLNDLSRGDRVTFSGDWRRNGVFEAYRIDSLRDRRR